MLKFRVGIGEVWMRVFLVEAETRDDAIIKAGSAQGKEQSFAFVEHIPTSEWIVEDTEPESLFLEALASIAELTQALESVGVPKTSSLFYRANNLERRMAEAYERTTGRVASDELTTQDLD